jgi:hypothetical protein
MIFCKEHFSLTQALFSTVRRHSECLVKLEGHRRIISEDVLKVLNSERLPREIGMKKLAVSSIFLLVLVACATTKGAPPQEFGGKPDVFCNVIQEPDPVLMGTWECRFVRTVGKSRPDDNHVKYRLLKQDDKYGLYFYRTWRDGKRKKAEWKNWTISGKEIVGEPRRFGVKIFVRGEDVYFTIRDLDKPAKMSRVVD